MFFGLADRTSFLTFYANSNVAKIFTNTSSNFYNIQYFRGPPFEGQSINDFTFTRIVNFY